MHEPLLNASSTPPVLSADGPQASPSAAASSRPQGEGHPLRHSDVVVQIDDGPFMDECASAAELAQASQSSLRLLSGLPPMPDASDRELVESWMSARHLANARLTAALLAVRRGYPAVRVSSQLCTEGPALLAATLYPQPDVVLARRGWTGSVG